ncbi:tripartite tricarboxylate transporter permease [Rhodobaculum claviforme]|uniref:C4-dicarboxylate ABC transporter permease n=1 Tax=Rhodobaculum claviforme TaxID=1549854 RepID=A0A934TJS4_9RHOB|nr:tripartite tricarboxylate transporter permease [Rhodobaculum claviforme]MBK5926741.1 C4-dicarboxylate ABC transporter permease [Rhodobaculum claviforme]
MWSDIAAGLTLFWGLDNVLAISGGVLLGVVVGAIPGLTATMAVALALPLTFAMAPVTAILLLVGVYKGGVFGGSITAILLRAPGTPAAAATLLDGYPLAQQGKAGKAMKMALYASCIADFLSNIALIFFAGMIAGLALAFGPPEFFWLICFSLTVVIAIAGSSLAKGLISGALGLLVSTVGLDLVQGSQRFTFDNFNLMGGVGYIPLLIGLFALPEVIDFYVRRGAPFAVRAADASRVTMAEFKRSLVSIVRGSFIGVIIGTIPGAGATAAAFLSYGEAKRSSRHPETFGKGEIEGVAAAESGNNGVAGATMIPLLSLGIPGDVVTAVILGAFMLHGLAPGPMMFQQNLDIIYALFAGIMLSSVVLFVAGSLAIRYVIRIVDIPRHILMPLVLLFCVFGTFAVQAQMFDVLVMVVFGALGYLMLRINMSAAPFLMGFILGPLFEDNLRRTFLIAQDMSVFFRSPICWIFIVLTGVSLFIGIRREMRTLRARRTLARLEGS